MDLRRPRPPMEPFASKVSPWSRCRPSYRRECSRMRHRIGQATQMLEAKKDAGGCTSSDGCNKLWLTSYQTLVASALSYAAVSQGGSVTVHCATASQAEEQLPPLSCLPARLSIFHPSLLHWLQVFIQMKEANILDCRKNWTERPEYLKIPF